MNCPKVDAVTYPYKKNGWEFGTQRNLLGGGGSNSFNSLPGDLVCNQKGWRMLRERVGQLKRERCPSPSNSLGKEHPLLQGLSNSWGHAFASMWVFFTLWVVGGLAKQKKKQDNACFFEDGHRTCSLRQVANETRGERDNPFQLVSLRQVTAQ